MKLEWLDDLLAVIETGSLREASKRRFLTQPAFTRRIQAIERYVGAELFDRSCKPLQLRSSVRANEPRIRQLSRSIRELSKDLGQGNSGQHLFVLACQHSISTAVAPALVKALSETMDSRIRLRSANRDECYSLLLTGEADVVLMYQTKNEYAEKPSEFIESRVIGQDAFIPVQKKEDEDNNLDWSKPDKLVIVGYPENVFLGRVFNQTIMPELDNVHDVRCIAETGLTPAALQFALSGVGIAWVPRSLAQSQLDAGNLQDLSESLPSLALEITVLHLKQEDNELQNSVWEWFLSNELPLR